jgi:hypothetical protein
MQPSRLIFIFIPQAISNPRTGAAHFYVRSTKHEFRKLRKSGKPGIALRIYRAKIAVRRISSEYSSE